MTTIYIIRARRSRQGRHVVKIGRTDQVERRLAELQAATSDRLEVLHTATGPTWIEAMVHQEYAHRRIRGEWFSLTDTELARAAAMIAGEVEPASPRAKRTQGVARAKARTAERRRALGVLPRDGRARCSPTTTRAMTAEELARMKPGTG